MRLLPQRQREVLVLRFYLGLREGQIAATMGISRGTVKAHIRRAMATLRDVLAPAAWPDGPNATERGPARDHRSVRPAAPPALATAGPMSAMGTCGRTG